MFEGDVRLTEVPPGDAGSLEGGEPTIPYKDQELERLWAHNLHEDNMYMQRGNFFLVAESLLLVAYSAVLASRARTETDILTASRIISCFGLALTGVWALISHRHMTYQRFIRQRALACSANFAIQGLLGKIHNLVGGERFIPTPCYLMAYLV